MPEKSADIHSFLPLSLTLFHILLALGNGDLHGYGIMREVMEHSHGQVRLSAGALYDSIKRLTTMGLIVECEKMSENRVDEERRRNYRITLLGQQVVAAEVERLTRLVEVARTKSLFSATEQPL